MYQKIILVGNLGRDPEMRYTPSGQSVTSFSMATTEKWTDRNTSEQRERTTWWRVSVWGRMGEACNQYLSKGRQVFVEARMDPDPETGGPRVWTRNDGTPGASYEVTALNVKFLGGGRGDVGTADVDEFGGGPPPVDESEIPF